MQFFEPRTVFDQNLLRGLFLRDITNADKKGQPYEQVSENASINSSIQLMQAPKLETQILSVPRANTKSQREHVEPSFL